MMLIVWRYHFETSKNVFVYTSLNGFKYCEGLNISMWVFDASLTTLKPRFRVDLGVMAMRELSAFIKGPEMMSPYQIQFTVIPKFYLTNRWDPNNQGGPGSNWKERVLRIPLNSITAASQLDNLVSYPRH